MGTKRRDTTLNKALSKIFEEEEAKFDIRV